MIRKQDILDRAAEWGLRADVVEKDYVLGWLLVGVARHAETGASWVFKGGTCLKKCFFETYRFSEDLDFSITSTAAYSAEAIERQIADLTSDVHGLSGIAFPSPPRVESVKNKQDQPTFRVRIEYSGPLVKPGGPKVLIDITQHELLAAPPARRPVFHAYPDDLPVDLLVATYSLEELFAEKTRALYERTRPRDLYDVVQLVDNFGDHIDFEEARALFAAKCRHKSIEPPTGAQLASLVAASTELEADWNHMLGHQLPALPPLAAILGRIGEILGWLDEVAAPAGEEADEIAAPVAEEPAAPTVSAPPWAPPPVLAPPPSRRVLAHLAGKAGEVLVAPAGVTYWGTAGLELVRFAGANRLMVEFSYHAKPRTVEPYSFHRAGTGNLLLYAWEPASSQIKAFKVAEMSGLRVSARAFVPRYSVDLTGISESAPRARGPRRPGRTTRRRR